MINKEVLLKYGSINLAGKATRQFLSLLYVVIITRLVPPDVFGLFSIAVSVVVIARLLDLEIGQSINYFVPSANEERRGRLLLTSLFVSVILSTTAAIILFIFAEHIAAILRSGNSARYIQVLSIFLPSISVCKLLFKFYPSIGRTRKQVIDENIVYPASKLLSTIALALVLPPYLALPIGYASGYLLILLYSLIDVYSYVDNRGTELLNPSDGKQMMSYSLPLAITGVVWMLMTKVDYLILSALSTASVVGGYRVSYSLSSLVLVFGSIFNPLFKPAVSGSDDKKEILDAWNTVSKYTLILGYLVALPLIVVPDLVLRLGFSPDYALPNTVIVLTVGFLISTLFGPQDRVLAGMGHNRLVAANTFLLVTVNIAGGIFFVQQFGPIGAAVGTMLAVVIRSVLGAMEVYYTHGIIPVNRAQVLVPFFTAVGVIVSLGLPAVGELSGSLLYLAIVYLSFLSGLFISGCLTVQEVRSAVGIGKRVLSS